MAAVTDALDECVQGRPPDLDTVHVVLRHADAELEALLTCGEHIRVARPVRIDV
jgi:hypothetical protein